MWLKNYSGLSRKWASIQSDDHDLVARLVAASRDSEGIAGPDDIKRLNVLEAKNTNAYRFHLTCRLARNRDVRNDGVPTILAIRLDSSSGIDFLSGLRN